MGPNAQALISLILSFLLFSGCSQSTIKELSNEDIVTNNRGVALMGQFDFEAASQVFTRLHQKHPENNIIQINQAISILNRQGPDDEKLALGILNQVLNRDKSFIPAQYCTALLELHMGQLEKALKYFFDILKIEPADPEVLYFTGKTLVQLSRYDEALDYFYQALEIDEYLSSAYYSIIMVMRQLGQRDEAMSMIQAYQKIRNNPRSRILDFKYTKMGNKAEAIALNTLRDRPITKPEGTLFNKPEKIMVENQKNFVIKNRVDSIQLNDKINRENHSIIVSDINDDGFPDLFIPRVFDKENQTYNAVLFGTAHLQNFTLDLDHPFASIKDINTALWGDVNDDGQLDVYFCINGENQLWLKKKDNSWQHQTMVALSPGQHLNTVDGSLFDADHDGDLDIFLVNIDGPNELLNNNRDTTFRPLAEDYGLLGENFASRSILLKDLDSDRDVDIIIINDQPPHEVYINQRLWKYNPAKGFNDFIHSDIQAAVAGDVNYDGDLEIYTLDSTYNLFMWQLNQDRVWQKKQIFTAADHNRPDNKRNYFRLSLLDYDGDGHIDIFTSNDRGWNILSFKNNSIKPLYSFQDGLNHSTIRAMARISTSAGPAVVAATPGENLNIWTPGQGRFKFCNISLSGRQTPDKSIRTNTSGIGATLTIRNGSQWTILDTFRNDSGPGQGYQPLPVGMIQSKQLDFVKIEWPDGVFQTEMKLEHQKNHNIVETQRQMSSCPVLFGWDGDKFEFVSDILGVGGIGYAIGPGEYADPRPWENFMFPKDLLKPYNDRLLIKLTEPMEEVEYLDAVRLKAYDLPPGWSMTMDERMGISAPFPTGNNLFYNTSFLPLKGINDRQEDVTPYIVKNDLIASPPGPIDNRFIGRLEKNHSLTLVFPEAIKAMQSDPILVIDGWVEYPYSQTSFAAWQAKAHYLAPTIEYETSHGEWKVLFDQFGYPAGMPRQMSVPLNGIPKGVNKIRITTNQEIYWDKIAIAYPQICDDLEIHQLELKEAKLEQIGFPQRIDFDQHRPYYDYSNRHPLWDTRLQEGFYTKFGDVIELIQNKDNGLAILGPGESIHMEFATPLKPVKPGWQRIYVLETHGWCKDMDLYTNTGETVAPIPYQGKLEKTAIKLNQQYNTRYLAGRL